MKQILKINAFVLNIEVRGTEIAQIFQTLQYQLLKSKSFKLNIKNQKNVTVW